MPSLKIPCSLCAFLLFPFSAAGCGGTSSEAKAPAEAGGAPGEKCLADAGAPREPAPDAPQTISVSHILVRHKDLKRPEGALLTREEACLRALDALRALESSGDWNQVVEDFSDSGKSTQGDLGKIGREDVTAAFGDAAFALEVDELSYVVETDRGFHVILRTQ